MVMRALLRLLLMAAGLMCTMITPAITAQVCDRNSSDVQFNKPLYLHGKGSSDGVLPDYIMDRLPSAVDTTPYAGSGSYTFTLAPEIQSTLNLNKDFSPVLNLLMRINRDAGSLNPLRVADVVFERIRNSVATPIASLSASRVLNIELIDGAFGSIRIDVPYISADDPNLLELQNGDQLQLRFTVDTGRNRSLKLDIADSIVLDGERRHSALLLSSETVVNIESIGIFDSPGGGTEQDRLNSNQPYYARTFITDPFGHYDISSVESTIIDANGSVLSSSNSMEKIEGLSIGATGVYELEFISSENVTNFNITVSAQEGFEGFEADTCQRIYQNNVVLELIKNQRAIEDPFNGSILDGGNPKAITGALVQYDITVVNRDDVVIDRDGIIIVDNLPAEVALFVGNYANGLPVAITSSENSGMSIESADIEYSNDGISFDYLPMPDGDGYDSNIVAIRLIPTGSLAATTDEARPSSFKLSFLARVL